MNGFDRELKNRVLGMIPQATVSSTQILTDWPELAKKLKVIRMSRVLPFYSVTRHVDCTWSGGRHYGDWDRTQIRNQGFYYPKSYGCREY
jgi:hypothetical protein